MRDGLCGYQHTPAYASIRGMSDELCVFSFCIPLLLFFLSCFSLLCDCVHVFVFVYVH